jgi:hypothetical protein
MDKTKVIAIILGCLIIAIAIIPSINTGEISESISKFIKAFAAFFSAILFGLSGNDNGA